MDQNSYRQIKDRGYYIDVRGSYPLLIRGNRVWSFNNWDAALAFALKREGLA